MRRIVTALLAVSGAALAAACLFFTWYTVRLIYITATGAVNASHRTGGYYIGVICFPIAACGFGWASLRCLRAAGRHNRMSDAGG
jgi:ABC-type transport system involved in cytochrome c biogenesis permease component